jgi:hypothetical protein
LSRRSSTERLAPASKEIFENAFNVSGGWDKAECDGHEIYNWEISEPVTFPAFLTVNVTATSMSFSLMLGSDTSRPEYWKVV